MEHPQPPIQKVPGAIFSGVKRLEFKAKHSPTTIAEVKKTWIYTYIHVVVLS
jgi:hypothetical protein